jgi:glycosyltransferase involved in cell wall biosynthesis
MTEKSIWIVIPAYNEGGVIASTVATVLPIYRDIVVVDDGSRDETANIAWRAGAHVVRHPLNLGQGAALQTGLCYALSRGADLIVTFDADGQHDVADVARLLQALESGLYDVAIGSRFLGNTSGMPAIRRAVLKAAIIVTWLLSGLRLSDAHNGFRAFTRHAASSIRLRQNRMAHASEIIEQIAALGLRYVEVPVTIRYTQYSREKGQRTIDSVFVLKDLLLERFFR